MKSQAEIINTFKAAKRSAEKLLSNELKKGDLIKMRGTDWYGEILDNLKGNTRVANIHGWATEAGSIYVWDIALACKNGELHQINLTAKQQKDREWVNNMFG